MLTLIEHGEIYAPEPLGRVPLLLGFDRVASVGRVERSQIEGLDLEIDYINASGCVVTPGLIDPHEHLAGGSAEDGFSTQTPEIHASEIVSAGITTVVGVLGSDTTMISPSGLLSKVKALKEEGLNAFMWTGGYNLPPTSVTESVRSDLLYIEEVIGAGELAIADRRSTDPSAAELARLVSDVYVAGTISRKAGRTHFHVGETDRRLSTIREMLDDFDVNPDSLYLTHIERTEKLMDEAIEVVRRGAWADIDVVEEDLAKWLPYYLEHGGDPERLTLSSDAYLTSPVNLIGQLRALVLEHGWPLERVLPFVTTNAARVLKLDREKGRIAPGMSADLVVMRRESLEIVELIAKGRRLVRGGRVALRERFLQENNRRIHLVGDEAEGRMDA
jgi:beta-aspartyl-dipeptidase (metallo-type)